MSKKLQIVWNALDEIQGKVDEALEQAKESGEFDGADGAAGIHIAGDGERPEGTYVELDFDGTDVGELLPPVTTEDNGKTIGVVDGEWQLTDAPTGGTGGTSSVDWANIENKPFDGVAKVISWDGNTEGLETVDLLGMATLYKVSDDFIRFNESDMTAGKYYTIAGEIDSTGIADQDKVTLNQVWNLPFEDLGAFCVNNGESFATFPHFASVVEDNTTFTVDGTALGMGEISITFEKAGTYFTLLEGTAVTELGFVDVVSQIPVDFIPEEAFCTAQLTDYGSYSVLKITDRHGNSQYAYINDGATGADGANGADGYTPQKGIDYYTQAEKNELKAELVDDVLAALPSAEGVEF